MTRLALVGVLLAALAPAADVRRPAAPGEALKEDGFTFRLGEGALEEPSPAVSTVAPSEPLGDAETQRVLDRLPAWSAPRDEEKPVALRESSLPPPRPGHTVKEPFPPPAEAASAPERGEAGPLRILRRSPEGEVPVGPLLSVTFSQPMVAVTGHEDLALQAPPVRLEPQPPGRWRWVGTRTLLFEPTGRFPMATEYRAVVPAGTRSAAGGTLEAAAAWTFVTPPPSLVTSHPVGGPARRDPLLFAAFDQRIDRAAVARSLQLRASGATVGVVVATEAEIEQDSAVKALAAGAQEGRWLAFRPMRPLPAEAEVAVVVPMGTPSAEGPKTTAKDQTWSFRTFGPLRVVGHRCGWGEKCAPLSPWQIDLSNPVDAKAFRKEMVRVTPELPGFKVEVHGSSLTLRGATRGRTTYTVTLEAALPDVFGQTLGAPASVTFAVGSAPESLFAPGGPLVVLDPAAGPRFSVYTTNQSNLKVRAFTVGPEDWPAFIQYFQNSWRDDKATPPGRRVLATTVPVSGAPDTLVETRLDLLAALPGGLGHAVVVVEPGAAPKRGGRPPAVRVWVEATRIGLSAFADDRSLVAWASSLTDGRPLAGVRVSLGAGAATTTGVDGTATLALPTAPSAVLVARQGTDVALLPETAGFWNTESGWRRQESVETLRFYVFDDRGMYRPGEEVKVKGWIRLVGAGPQGDVGPGPGGGSVGYVLSDAQGNEVAKGRTPLSAFGSFDLALALPGAMNLGPAELALDVEGGRPGSSHEHSFQVQEFRRPEFEVKATASEGPHFVGGRATVTVAASYYAGGALPETEVAWRVTSSPGSFTPPNRDDFSFGPARPWWERRLVRRAPGRTVSYDARTDALGRHRLRIDFDRADPPQPESVRAEATVRDVNRQAFSAAATLLVHPASLYLGLKAERVFVQPGEALRVGAIAADLDGRAVAGRPLALVLERLDWEQEEGEWTQKAVDPEDCATTSGAEAVRCTFRPKAGGAYRLTGSLTDDAGRPNQSELRLFVAGGPVPPRRDLEQEAVTLVPDRKEYRAGDVARVLVLAPFAPAEGMLTLRRSGLLRHTRFTMRGASHTLEIPVEEAWTPDVHVQVDLVGAAPRTSDAGEPDPRLPPRPAFASGELSLEVPPLARTLALAVMPRESALAPGEKTVLDLSLADASGQPVAGGEVAVVVVDEAVLALTGYRLPDPIATFYAPREAGVSDHHLRASILLGRPDGLPENTGQDLMLRAQAVSAATMAIVSAPATMSVVALGRASEEPAPIALRADFKALALFAARVPTDARGRAQVPVTLPDSLTRYRVMAVAAAGGRSFGKGESTITARLPLMVRPSPPRFLNFGDRFDLTVVVQNQTGGPLAVDVVARARNAELPAGAGRRVAVPAHDRVEVRFPAAAERAGTARFQVGAASGAFADAAEVSLPVWTPATTEAFATYGQIDQGSVRQPVRAPADAIAAFGGLEVTSSSTALQALTDAVLYLVAYPFECAEQLSSRVLAVAALGDVLTAFRAQGLPSSEEMRAAGKRDVDRLRALQNDDGGFAFWRRGDPSWPYVGIHVAHALARAQEKGFLVPKETLDRSRRYLREIEKHLPADTPDEVRWSLLAYALDVRARLGDGDPTRAQALVREVGADKLPFEAVGWLLPILGRDPAARAEAASLRTLLANRVTETAGTAHFAVSYRDGAHLILASNRRADAIVLEALIADQPQNDLIPKLALGLLAQRRAGRWTNTQENAFVLLALDRYFQTYEKTTPDFVARAWLGDRYAGEQAFRGRGTDRHQVEIPMTALLAAKGPTDLVLAKEGAGRLYYRIGLRYAPTSLRLDPADHGFTVERLYQPVDDKNDVRRDGDGTWHVRAGARVRIRLTMVAAARRYHVALVDPLPAGLEPLNPALALTGALPSSDATDLTTVGAPGLGGPRRTGSFWWWTRPWFEHQNLRDERAEAFTSLLWEGVYTYTYFARATTPGTFVVPPARAEEMYAPETFGRGGTDQVVVE